MKNKKLLDHNKSGINFYFAFGLRYMLISLYYCLYCSFSWVYSDVRIGSPGDSLLGRHHYAAWVSIWLLVV